ncbi:hypothetical protein EZS27_031536 [termite gut metagenome]|uniref:Uncharacterized protein n=1 Tax=termite gut metagenome TaxID=433724 RepID=A0A5J4Q8U4_9ZZZZ
MDTRMKTAFYWLLLGICFLAHNLFGLTGLFFGKSVTVPDATGEIPIFLFLFSRENAIFAFAPSNEKHIEVK